MSSTARIWASTWSRRNYCLVSTYKNEREYNKTRLRDSKPMALWMKVKMKDCAFLVWQMHEHSNIIRGVEKFFGRFAYANNQIRPKTIFSVPPPFHSCKLFRRIVFSWSVHKVITRCFFVLLATKFPDEWKFGEANEIDLNWHRFGVVA